MRVARHFLAFLLAAVAAAGQSTPSQSAVAELNASATAGVAGASIHLVSTPLFDIRQSDLKFSVDRLMLTLKDPLHEGWILAAYPDPATRRPLIGAGFSLDVDARAHPQLDPLNPHSFLEPSSAQLWQAAGLDPTKLQTILTQYQHTLSRWPKSNRAKRKKLRGLTPQITDEDALALLRISSVQAAYNARAYCRYFDQMTPSQQMGLSEMVFQMGVNLEQFTNFLSVINHNEDVLDLLSNDISAESEREHWQLAQQTLVASQWAHRYRGRAISVIAKFDPDYAASPFAAESRVAALLPAPPKPHRAAHKVSKHTSKTRG